MEEIGKIKKIYKGFFPDEVVSEKRMAFRREQCAGCIYNSKNAVEEDLSGVDTNRKKVFNSNFCTLCKCQIIEKTQSPHEECAAYYVDEPKKWFKTRVEVENRNAFNITNLTDNEIDLRIEGPNFTVDYGSIYDDADTNVELLLDSEATTFKVVEIHPTCGCTAAKIEESESGVVLKFRVNLLDIAFGKFVKGIHVEYTVAGKPYKKTIFIKGFKKKEDGE